MLNPKYLDAAPRTLVERFALAFRRAGWRERYVKEDDRGNLHDDGDGQFVEKEGEEESGGAGEPNKTRHRLRKAPFGTAKSIAEVVDRATNSDGDGKRRWFAYRDVDDPEADKIQRATGLNVQGYVHAVDESAVRHILSGHGPGAAGLDPDEIPLTEDDVRNFHAFIEKAREIELSPKSTAERRLPAIRYITKVNGWYCVVEEVHAGRDRMALTLHTMFKTRNDPRNRG